MVRKLVTQRMSALAVPPGCADPLGSALSSLLDAKRIAEHARIAIAEIVAALDAVRAAPDYDPAEHGASDEEIAARILAMADARRRSQLAPRG
jgi:hypothetical protein